MDSKRPILVVAGGVALLTAAIALHKFVGGLYQLGIDSQTTTDEPKAEEEPVTQQPKTKVAAPRKNGQFSKH